MLKAILTFILGNVSKIIFLISIAKIMVLRDITLKKDVTFRERNKTLKNIPQMLDFKWINGSKS